MNRDIVNLLQFQPEFVQRQIAMLAQPTTDPSLQALQLAGLAQIVLAFSAQAPPSRDVA